MLREATAALQSIFPPMSLLKFMQQGRIDKRAQIRELAHVVAGIRIFNWVNIRAFNWVNYPHFDINHILALILNSMVWEF